MSVHLSLVIPIGEDFARQIVFRDDITASASSSTWNKLFESEGVNDVILYTPLFKRAGVLLTADGRYKIPDEFLRQVNAHARTRYVIADIKASGGGISVEKCSATLKGSLYMQAFSLKCALKNAKELFKNKSIIDGALPVAAYNSRNTCCFQWLTVSLKKNGLLSFGTFPHPGCVVTKEQQILIDHKIFKWYSGAAA